MPKVVPYLHRISKFNYCIFCNSSTFNSNYFAYLRTVGQMSAKAVRNHHARCASAC